MPLSHCDVLAILWRSIQAMGCFFGCFRIRDNHHRSRPQIVSNSVQPNTKEAVVSRNRLSSLFLSEEEEGKDFAVKDRENLTRRFGWSEVDDKELKDEARFLKACGALPETPAEIRKASKKLTDSPHDGSNSEPSEFHSWLPNTSISKLLKDKQLNEPPTPINFNEKQGTGLDPVKDSSPSSCVIDEHSEISIAISSPESRDVNSSETAVNLQDDGATSIAVSSLSAGPSVVKSQRNKSVRFEGEPAPSESSPGVIVQNLEKSDSTGSQPMLKPSPASTPLKLTDDMQTPGTVFATNLEDLDNGNKARIRSQYVYTILNPPGNPAQQKMVKDEVMITDQASVTRGEAHGIEHDTPNLDLSKGESSVKKDLNVDVSLSAWLKPPPNRDVNGNPGAARFRRPNAGRTHGDRPILGMVAAHWKEDEEFSRISPKQCGGNGIPNSTTKYKEDQKVSWHATPFEERLEKALSEETLVSQRKPISGAPIAFEDHDADTAASHFQSSSLPKSVTSF
ncbi:hypothetical protein Ancab_012858 [Ancistrocladus abbreviatus]